MKEKLSTQYNDAVKQIKTAILQSQAKALKGVNQEQLALYYGIGRYISQNSREGFWGKDAISTISRQLSIEMPGLKGFSPRNLRNMRLFTRNGSVSTLIWQMHLPKRRWFWYDTFTVGRYSCCSLFQHWFFTFRLSPYSMTPTKQIPSIPFPCILLSYTQIAIHIIIY